MYFQFLTEDKSTNILVNHVMKKLSEKHEEKMTIWNIKSFSGIGHLPSKGNALERKTGKLLNDLPMYLRAFNKVLRDMRDSVLIIVLDNDKRDVRQFREELNDVAVFNNISCDYVFCIAVKELEAWMLGDEEAIKEAYPDAKMQHIKRYYQDGICETWEVLADIVYPHGHAKLKKNAGGSYSLIGKMKCEWADKIGSCMHLHENQSPSYKTFIDELEKRILI